MNEQHLVCCGCEYATEQSETIDCPRCGCVLEIDVGYYINRIVELEKQVRENELEKENIRKWILEGYTRIE